MRFPSIRHVRAALAAEHAYLRRTFCDEDLRDSEGCAGTDVRLQVYDDGQYAIRTGDASYDQDHRGFWGSSFLPYNRTNLSDLARELIEQAREHRASTASPTLRTAQGLGPERPFHREA